MLLGFQKQFVSNIRLGNKTITIRKERKDKKIPEIGEKLYMYTGLRIRGKKAMRIFLEGREPVCKFVYPIEINIDYIKSEYFFLEIQKWNYYIVNFANIINGRHRFGLEVLQNFIKRDGFDSFGGWYEFFEKYHQIDKKPFKGNIIGWEIQK